MEQRNGSSDKVETLIGRPRRVGRTPSVVYLESDLLIVNNNDDNDDDLGLDDTNNYNGNDIDNNGKGDNNDNEEEEKIVERLRTAGGMERAEDVAWFMQYEEMKDVIVGRGGDECLDGTDDGPHEGSSSVDGEGSGNRRKKKRRRRLELWAVNQRKQYAKYRSGQTSNLTNRRIQLLNKIGFDWELSEEEDDGYAVNGKEKEEEEEGWDTMVSKLRSFKEEYGHCFIPKDYYPNPPLGQWVHLQRELFRQYTSTDNDDSDLPHELHPLPPSPSSIRNRNDDRVQELIRIGLDLAMDNFSYCQMSFGTIWNARFQDLKRYKQKYGHCDIPIDYASPYYDLALWVKEQRLLYQRVMLDDVPTQLDKARISDLDSIGFLWEGQ